MFLTHEVLGVPTNKGSSGEGVFPVVFALREVVEGQTFDLRRKRKNLASKAKVV